MSGISQLLGLTLSSVTVNKDDGDEIIFRTDGGRAFRMYHSPDCCESVTIDDICGDIKDLEGSPILMAEESTSNQDTEGGAGQKAGTGDYSFTWTFYRLATIKGYVTIRWYGSSNGYYSERVDFVEVRSS